MSRPTEAMRDVLAVAAAAAAVAAAVVAVAAAVDAAEGEDSKDWDLYLEHGEAVGDLDHRRPGRLDIQEAAWRSREAHNSARVPVAPMVVRGRRRWQAALVEGTTVFHHVGVAKPQYCGDVGTQCGLVQRLALGRKRG